MQKIKNLLRSGSFENHVLVPAKIPVQVYVAGPVRCIAHFEADGGITQVPLGVLDGLVEFQTVTDWKITAEGGKVAFFSNRGERSKPAKRDVTCYTSLDLPRPLTETERLIRELIQRTERLERAKHAVPTEPIRTSDDGAASKGDAGQAEPDAENEDQPDPGSDDQQAA